jgi:MFS family permease
MDPDTTDETDGRELLTDGRFLCITLASGVGVFGNQAIPAVLPSIGTGLALSETQIGLVMTVFFFTSMVSVPTLGAAADIYGRRPVILGSLLSFGGAGVAVFFVDSFGGLLALRAIQGIGLSGTTGLSVAFLGDFFEGPTGTTAQGLRSSANGLTIIVAPAVAGVLAAVGWRYPFLLYGAAIPVAVLVYLYLPEGAETRGDGGSAAASMGTELRRYGETMRESLSDRNVAVLVLGGFTMFFVRYGLLTIVPLLAAQRLGATPAVLGLALSVVGLVRVVVSPFSGALVERVSRKVAFALTMGVVALSMGLLSAVPNVPAMVGALVVFSVGMALFNPVLNDTITATATAETRAGVVSTVQTAKAVANTASPALFTLLLSLAGFAVVFLTAAGIALAYVGVVALVLDPEAY